MIQINDESIRLTCGDRCENATRIELPEHWVSLDELEQWAHSEAEDEGWDDGLCPTCARIQAAEERGDRERMIRNSEYI